MLPPPESAPPAPAVVLDTNVVLDCWLFRTPAALPLRQALVRREVRWVATAEMLNELRTVLARPLDVRWERERERLLSRFPYPDETLAGATPRIAHGLRCSDASDQKFLDLALREPVRWLLTRDKALLRLRRQAAILGLAILPPESWEAAADR